MNPQGSNTQGIAVAPQGNAPQSAPVAPQQGQQPQMQPQQFNAPQQPVQQFQTQPQITMPAMAPNPNLPQHQQYVAPAQQPQQQASPYEPVYRELATALGTSEDALRQHFQDNPQLFASTIASAVMRVRNDRQQQQQITPQQQQAQQTQQQPTVQPVGIVALPPGADQFIRRGADGVYEPVNPAYKQYADIANHNAMVEAAQMQQIARDPSSLFKDQSIQQYIQEQVKAEAAQLIEKQNIVNLRASIREKYGSQIVVTGPDGKPQRGLDGQNILTPFGHAFDARCQQLAASGMKENADFYETARVLAANDVGGMPGQNQQQAQQPQQQQYQSPVQQYAQPQPMNGMQHIMQQSQNAQQYYPGTPPVRQQQVPANLTPQGALQMALANEPDGMTMDYYLKKFGGGSLFPVN